MNTSAKVITFIGALSLIFLAYMGMEALHFHQKSAQCERAGGLYTTVNPNDESTYMCFRAMP